MLALSDQIGRKLEFAQTPERLVSLVPSITELICDFGLGYKLVGVTKYCVQPEGLRFETAQIGGTKKPEIEHIRRLEPDFIIANKEENTKESIAELEKIAPVYVSDISNFQELETCALAIGQICNVPVSAAAAMGRVKLAHAMLQFDFSSNIVRSALYLIWKKPYMAAGTDTYISWMLSSIGLSNALEQWKEKGKRYPKLDLEAIRALKPEVILLSSEPYPFTAKMANELQQTLGIPCICVDGEAFSWYGTRILETAPYIIHIGQQVHHSYR